MFINLQAIIQTRIH